MQPLAGQHALITGAGRGIGRALASRLAAEGARVSLTARSGAELESLATQIRSSGGEAAAIAGDVADATAVAQVVRAAHNQLGPVSILINNAGIPGPYGPVGAIDPLEWWSAQQVNVLGPLLYMRGVIPGMRALGAGRIINIVSSAGVEPVPHLSAYAVSKCTLIRLSETVDREERAAGIRVFALHPGTITTDMARGTIASAQAQRWLPGGVAMLKGRTEAESAADLARCCEVAAALAAGRHDSLGGRYLDLWWDLQAKAGEG
jgi:NAD(P)-dependent dehydrogenase (short-subunit alcohol dehydrogenase family)